MILISFVETKGTDTLPLG